MNVKKSSLSSLPQVPAAEDAPPAPAASSSRSAPPVVSGALVNLDSRAPSGNKPAGGRLRLQDLPTEILRDITMRVPLKDRPSLGKAAQGSFLPEIQGEVRAAEITMGTFITSSGWRTIAMDEFNALLKSVRALPEHLRSEPLTRRGVDFHFLPEEERAEGFANFVKTIQTLPKAHRKEALIAARKHLGLLQESERPAAFDSLLEACGPLSDEDRSELLKELVFPVILLPGTVKLAKLDKLIEAMGGLPEALRVEPLMEFNQYPSLFQVPAVFDRVLQAIGQLQSEALRIGPLIAYTQRIKDLPDGTRAAMLDDVLEMLNPLSEPLDDGLGKFEPLSESNRSKLLVALAQQTGSMPEGVHATKFDSVIRAIEQLRRPNRVAPLTALYRQQMVVDYPRRFNDPNFGGTPDVRPRPDRAREIAAVTAMLNAA